MKLMRMEMVGLPAELAFSVAEAVLPLTLSGPETRFQPSGSRKMPRLYTVRGTTAAEMPPSRLLAFSSSEPGVATSAWITPLRSSSEGIGLVAAKDALMPCAGYQPVFGSAVLSPDCAC